MYRIPTEIRYKEKFAFGLTFKQCFYMAGSGIASALVFYSGMPLKKQVSMCLIGLGLCLSFLDLDRLIIQAIQFTMTKTRLAGIRDVARDFLGIEEIRGNSVVLKDGLVAVIKVKGINFSMLSDEQREDVIHFFRMFLNSLNFEVQLVVRSVDPDMDSYFQRLEKNTENREEIRNFKDFLTNYLRENRVMDRKCYVVIPLRKNSKFTVRNQGITHDELDKRVNTVMENLETINLRPKRLEKEELMELFRSYFDSDVVPNSFIQSPTEVGFDTIRINERYNQIIAADGFPDSVNEGWLEKLVLMPGDYDLCIHIKPHETGEGIRLLNREIKKQETDMLRMERKNEFIPVSLQIQEKETKELLVDLQHGRERLFDTSIYVNARAYTKKGLKQLTDNIQSNLKSVMIEPKVVNLRIEAAIKSVLPLADNRLGISRTLTSSSLSACFPFLSPGFSIEDEGIFFGVDDDTRIPIIIDQFRLMNANGLVLGMAGSGKSFAVKLLCTKNLMFPDRFLYVLDREGEYRNITETYKGQIVKIAPESNTFLNPFDLLGMNPVDKKLSLHLFMHTIFDDLSEAQRSLLDEAFHYIYERKGITENPDTWSNEAPTFTDLYDFISAKEFDENQDVKRSASALARKLKIFTTGSLSFLNNQTNVDLQNRFVTFDLKDVPKSMVESVTYVILEYLMQRMKKDLRRKTIVVDECWSVLQNPMIGEYVFEMARTGRKRNTCLIVITQQVGDFLSRKPDGTIPGQTILGNTSWKLIMWQDNSVLKDVSRTFNLNRREKRRISGKDSRSAGQGKGLLLVENTSIPLRVIASPEEHQRITTNPNELTDCISRRTEPKIFHTDKKVLLMSGLEEDQIKDLLKQGYKKVRDPGFGRGRGNIWLVKNDTHETNPHFILWNLIYEEVKKHTRKVQTHRTKFPDITFESPKGIIAVEVETGSNLTYNADEFEEKLRILKGYSNFFIVLTKANLKKKYEDTIRPKTSRGEILTRTEIKDAIEKCFEKSEKPTAKKEVIKKEIKKETKPKEEPYPYIYYPTFTGKSEEELCSDLRKAFEYFRN